MKEYWGRIHRFNDGEIVCDDALAFLNALRPECADVVFLDPPFNLGKKYGRSGRASDKIKEEQYFDNLVQVIHSSSEVLKPGGALFLYHLPRWATIFSGVLNEALSFRHWIAISMKNGYPRGAYLHPAHYALLYYTKGYPANFSRPKIDLAECRHCGETIKDYGGYKKYLTDGVNLSDLWEDLSPVRHKKFKHRSSNELPLKLLSRVVEISGVKGGVLVDPFAGSGTALVAARNAGMKFVACDKEVEFLTTMTERLEKAGIGRTT